MTDISISLSGEKNKQKIGTFLETLGEGKIPIPELEYVSR